MNALNTADFKTYVSTFSKIGLSTRPRRVPTFRNKIEFIFSSIFVLPLLLFDISYQIIFKGYKTLYFPSSHAWNVPILAFGRLFGARSFLTIHDGRMHKGEYQWLQQKLYNLQMRMANYHIFLSEYVAKTTKEVIGIDKEHVIIPHALINHGVRPADLDRKAKPKPKLLFFGRIVNYKGIEMFMKALSMIPQDKYDCVTIAGQEWYHPSVNPDLNIKTIYKRLTDREVAELLSEHDILILPYIEASQSGILTVGVAHAIPMVISRVGGLVEQLSEAEAVFTDPNPEDLAKGIVKLIENEDLYLFLHQKMREKRKKMKWSDSAKNLMDFISSVK